MQESWVLGALTLIFGLLSSLQGVSGNETVQTCEDLHCPKGFICCENECCQESKIWDPDTERFTIPLIVFCVIAFALLCICGLVMCKCKGRHHDLKPGDDQTPPHPPSKAPLESIWVTVVLNSTGTETRPPYSLRPEGLTGQMRGPRYATL
ncbi:transmembrane protein 92-like [Rattus rattus]|uniref:transmembrane protein 92-like n=1 Tax=Rattus rattus TaxID=10117 RepID=UPI0013F2FF58|nr:transmembrane protein 92-like [Rattus rattus]